MFYYISGKIALKTESFAVIDANGIGYKIYASKNTLDDLGNAGENGKLYTFLNFKSASDIMDLYGFSTLEEQNLFEMITSVSRVGAKTAISLLSNISPSKFALCVVTNDFKYIAQKTPGLGAKGAQRIVLELKDKFKGMDIGSIDADEVISLPGADEDNEAVSALVVLGYSSQEAKSAVSGLTGSVEDIVKAALKKLMRG
jgi:Holliday junction DNA helicase RuvA